MLCSDYQGLYFCFKFFILGVFLKLHWDLRSSALSVPEHAKVFLDKVPLVLFGVDYFLCQRTVPGEYSDENSLNNEKQILKQSDAHTHAVSATVHHRAGVFPSQTRRGWSHS